MPDQISFPQDRKEDEEVSGPSPRPEYHAHRLENATWAKFRSAPLTISLLSGLIFVAWAATCKGLRDIYAVNSGTFINGEPATGWQYGILIAIISTLIVGSMWLCIDKAFSRSGSPRMRLVARATYIFLVLWSLGFEYGFFWSIFSGSERSARAMQDRLASVQDQIKQLSSKQADIQQSLVDQADVAIDKARNEFDSGGSCDNHRDSGPAFDVLTANRLTIARTLVTNVLTFAGQRSALSIDDKQKLSDLIKRYNALENRRPGGPIPGNILTDRFSAELERARSTDTAHTAGMDSADQTEQSVHQLITNIQARAYLAKSAGLPPLQPGSAEQQNRALEEMYNDAVVKIADMNKRHSDIMGYAEKALARMGEDLGGTPALPKPPTAPRTSPANQVGDQKGVCLDANEGNALIALSSKAGAGKDGIALPPPFRSTIGPRATEHAFQVFITGVFQPWQIWQASGPQADGQYQSATFEKLWTINNTIPLMFAFAIDLLIIVLTYFLHFGRRGPYSLPRTREVLRNNRLRDLMDDLKRFHPDFLNRQFWPYLAMDGDNVYFAPPRLRRGESEAHRRRHQRLWRILIRLSNMGAIRELASDEDARDRIEDRMQSLKGPVYPGAEGVWLITPEAVDDLLPDREMPDSVFPAQRRGNIWAPGDAVHEDETGRPVIPRGVRLTPIRHPH